VHEDDCWNIEIRWVDVAELLKEYQLGCGIFWFSFVVIFCLYVFCIQVKKTTIMGF